MYASHGVRDPSASVCSESSSSETRILHLRAIDSITEGGTALGRRAISALVIMLNSRSKVLSDSRLPSIDASSRILLVNESPKPRHATESKNIREVTDFRSSLKSADQYFFAFANICPTIRRHNSCSRLL